MNLMNVTESYRGILKKKIKFILLNLIKKKNKLCRKKNDILISTLVKNV